MCWYPPKKQLCMYSYVFKTAFRKMHSNLTLHNKMALGNERTHYIIPIPFSILLIFTSSFHVCR